MRVATVFALEFFPAVNISIHATHAGGDSVFVHENHSFNISIHATHAGGDRHRSAGTLSEKYFNPRHPCGWRQDINLSSIWFLPISIHATHAGGDAISSFTLWLQKLFQSTPPMRVATIYNFFICHDGKNFNPRHPCGWRLSRPLASE